MRSSAKSLENYPEKSVQKNSKFSFRSILTILTICFFGLSILSIPTLSFNPSLNLVTWVLTAQFLVGMGIELIFFKPLNLDITICSIGLFLVSALISTLLNFRGDINFTVFLLGIVTGVAYLYFRKEPEKIRFALFSIEVASYIFVFTFITLYFKELISFDFSRLGEKFGDVNDVAIFTSLASLFSFWNLFNRKKIVLKILNAGLFLLSVFVGFATGSKIFILLIGLTCLLTIFTYFGKKKWYFSLLTVASALIVILVIFELPVFASYKERFLSFINTILGISQTRVDFSTVFRFRMFLDGTTMMLMKPLFGFGTRGYFVMSSVGSFGWSHNHISETLCSYGLLGAILFNFPIFYGISNYLRHRCPAGQKSTFCVIFLTMFVCCMLSIALDGMKIFAYSAPLLYAQLALNDSSITHQSKSIWNAAFPSRPIESRSSFQ